MLRAQSPQAGIDLVLDEGKPPVDTWHQRHQPEGRAAGQRLALLLADADADDTARSRSTASASTVTGESWMDHEFGTSFLEPEQRGWDWLSIQLSDDRELMLYQLRRADGTRDPRSSGTLVDAERQATHLADDDFTLTPGRATFKSKNGAVYPIEWTRRDPVTQHRACTSRRRSNDQELSLERSTGIAYWEGMIDVARHRRRHGARHGIRVSGDDGVSRQPRQGAVLAVGATGTCEGMQGWRIAVVGAGIAGLAAARALVDRGHDVECLRAGARSRRTRGDAASSARIELPRGSPAKLAFDHGAQYFTVRDQRFSELAAEWERDRVIAKWTGRIVSFDGEGWERRRAKAADRYVGTPGMSAIATALAAGLDIAYRAARSNRSSRCCSDFDRVILAIPADQARVLVAHVPALVRRSPRVTMKPCWTVMAAFEERVAARFDAAFVNGSALGWIARNTFEAETELEDRYLGAAGHHRLERRRTPTISRMMWARS